MPLSLREGNPVIGRTFRRRFSPRPRQMDGPLGSMLGMGAAVVGGMIVGRAWMTIAQHGPCRSLTFPSYCAL